MFLTMIQYRVKILQDSVKDQEDKNPGSSASAVFLISNFLIFTLPVKKTNKKCRTNSV